MKVASGKSETVHKIPLAVADETAAVEFMESVRWGAEPACPHCGSVEVYKMLRRGSEERNGRFLWRCHACTRQYTVRIGTVMEDSPIPVRFWVFAFWAASASKKGVSALQIRRQTGVSYKSALFMMHRIRWAMQHGTGTALLTGDIEVDETYVGGKPRRKPRPPVLRSEHSGRIISGGRTSKRGRAVEGFSDRKTPVVAILQRNGEVRTSVMTTVNGENLYKMLRHTVDRSARLHTDEGGAYRPVGKYFDGGHYTVNHKEWEYARDENGFKATTNTVEAFFALLKRGVIGTFHNVSRKHLHRYCSEFAFRWNTRTLDDGGRFIALIQNGDGARLTYAALTA